MACNVGLEGGAWWPSTTSIGIKLRRTFEFGARVDDWSLFHSLSPTLRGDYLAWQSWGFRQVGGTGGRSRSWRLFTQLGSIAPNMLFSGALPNFRQINLSWLCSQDLTTSTDVNFLCIVHLLQAEFATHGASGHWTTHYSVLLHLTRFDFVVVLKIFEVMVHVF